jgi:amidase
VADVLLGGHRPAAGRARLLSPTDVWGLIAPAVRPAWDGALQQIARTFGPSADTGVVLESFDAMYWAFRYVQGREAWMTDGAFIERYAPCWVPA